MAQTPKVRLGAVLACVVAPVLVLAFVLAACDPTAGNKAPPQPPQPPPRRPAKVGEPVPGFDAKNVSTKGGPAIHVVPGKVNLVFFWASWSGPDKQEMGRLEEVLKRHKERGLVIAAVSLDDEEKDLGAIAKGFGASYDVGWDEGHRIADRFRVETDPTTYVVDRKCIVRFIHNGYHDGETEVIEREVESLL